MPPISRYTVASYVFHDRGFRRRNLKTWDEATEAAKPRTGHTTDGIFRRYNIPSAA